MKSFNTYNMNFSILTEWRLPDFIIQAIEDQHIYDQILKLLKKQLLSDDKDQSDYVRFTFFDGWSNTNRNIDIEVDSLDADDDMVAGITRDQKYIILSGPNFWDYVTSSKVAPLTALKNALDHEIFHAIDPNFQKGVTKEKGSGKNYHLREHEIPAWMLTLIASLKNVIKTPEQLEKFKQTISLPVKQFVNELRILLYRNKLEKYGRDVFSYWKSHPEVMKSFRQKLYKSFFE